MKRLLFLLLLLTPLKLEAADVGGSV